MHSGCSSIRSALCLSIAKDQCDPMKKSEHVDSARGTARSREPAQGLVFSGGGNGARGGSRTLGRHWKRVSYSFYITPETLKTSKAPIRLRGGYVKSAEVAGTESLESKEVCIYSGPQVKRGALISVLNGYGRTAFE